MENEFLSIKKATEKYKASSSTITRFARQNSKTKFVKKENGKFLVSDSLLKAKFEKVESHDDLRIQTSNQSEPLPKNENELVTALKSENDFLRSQITSKDSQIDKLLQRQYEQNTIIQTLQSRIDSIGNKIDSSVLLLSEKIKENKNAPGPTKENDNGFTIASSVMIILLVLAIIVFLTVK